MNFNCCCVPNDKYFIEVKNFTPYLLSFIVQYTLDGQTYTNPSPVFGEDTLRRVFFSVNAQNVCFNVLNHNVTPTQFICNRVVTPVRTAYYRVIITSSGFQCIEY